tara:strand:- start:559 stop:672 length:114 start_codon:yes stop_codon:yes gene_type:complete
MLRITENEELLRTIKKSASTATTHTASVNKSGASLMD